jgi:hypothetical protein
MATVPGPLAGLPRRWWFPGLGTLRPEPSRRTYTAWDLDGQPAIALDGAGALDVLDRWPEVAGHVTDEEAVRPMDDAGLDALLASAVTAGPLPATLEAFIRDPAPRRRIRSVTACFLDLGEALVPVDGGGALVHVLTDQQWVLHWLAFVPPGGGDGPVVVTSVPFGFPDGLEAPARFDPGAADPELPELPAICADSFDEFLLRFALENEAWRRVNGIAAGDPPTPELEAYLAALRGGAA